MVSLSKQYLSSFFLHICVQLCFYLLFWMSVCNSNQQMVFMHASTLFYHRCLIFHVVLLSSMEVFVDWYGDNFH